jgi:hypothetical protein
MSSGYSALADNPYCACVPELLEIYPNAKVVLVRRDPQKWWTSMVNHFKNARNPVLPWLTTLSPRYRLFPKVCDLWAMEVDRILAEAGKEWGPGKHRSVSVSE